jgi:hypothetical protein
VIRTVQAERGTTAPVPIADVRAWLIDHGYGPGEGDGEIEF